MPLATTDPRRDGIMQTVTAPGASARTFLIHMFDRGLEAFTIQLYSGQVVSLPGNVVTERASW